MKELLDELNEALKGTVFTDGVVSTSQALEILSK